MKKNKIILLLLALLFIAPSISAYLLYRHPEWRSAHTTNKGHLVRPPQTISLFDEPKWHLVLWSPRTCDKACFERLAQLTKLRLALGRRYYSVDLWLILADKTTPPSERDIKEMATHQIHWARLSEQAETSVLSQQEQETIFIATPQQHVILQYEPHAKLDDIYHDLKHLLTTSDGKNVS